MLVFDAASSICAMICLSVPHVMTPLVCAPSRSMVSRGEGVHRLVSEQRRIRLGERAVSWSMPTLTQPWLLVTS